MILRRRPSRKPLLGILLGLLLGTALLVGGVVNAVSAGPEGLSRRAETTVDLSWDEGFAMTQPEVLSATGGRVRIDVTPVSYDSGPDVPLFLGVAHPDDAEDVLRGRSVARIEGVSRAPGALDLHPALELSHSWRRRDLGTIPVTDPTAAGIWEHRTRGSGTRVLDLPLDGTPRSVVAIGPVDGHLVVGTRYVLGPWLFWTSLVAAALGLALLVLGVIRWRRRRAAFAATAAEPYVPLFPAEREGPATPMHRLAVAVAVVPFAAGCSVPGAPTEASVGSLDRPALTDAQASAVWQDYTGRYAGAASRSLTHPELMATADSGMQLEHDRATIAELATEHRALTPIGAFVPGAVYATTGRGYPRVALASHGKTWSPGGSAPDRLAVLRQEHAEQPWTMDASASFYGTTLPAPAAARALTAAEKATVLRRAKELREYLAHDRPSAPSFAPERLSDAVAEAGGCGPREPHTRCTQTVRSAGTALDATAVGRDGVVAAPAQGGLLAMFTYRVEVTRWDADHRALVFDELTRTVYGPHPKAPVSKAFSLTYVVAMPDAGPATILNRPSTDGLPLPGVPLPRR